MDTETRNDILATLSKRQREALFDFIDGVIDDDPYGSLRGLRYELRMAMSREPASPRVSSRSSTRNA